MKNIVYFNEDYRISEFAKYKLFEISAQIDKSISTFFMRMKSEANEEYLCLLGKLEINTIAIPDSLLTPLKSFIYIDLDNLLHNPNLIFEDISPFDENAENSERLPDMKEDFIKKFYAPLQKQIKRYILYK